MYGDLFGTIMVMLGNDADAAGSISVMAVAAVSVSTRLLHLFEIDISDTAIGTHVDQRGTRNDSPDTSGGCRGMHELNGVSGNTYYDCFHPVMWSWEERTACCSLSESVIDGHSIIAPG